MFSWAKKTRIPNSVFVETTDAEKLRAQRVWRLVVVLWLTWNFFIGFVWFRGYVRATQICIIPSIVHLIILIGCRKNTNYDFVTHINLVTSGIGLFTVSVCDARLAVTMWFFPGSILVASQLLGVRGAFLWLLVSLVTFPTFFLVVCSGDTVAFWSCFDELVLYIGVATCVFFCCQQGEQFYQARTRDLINLSQHLQEKSDTLQELATTDALTGLINRLRFQERLLESTEESLANGERVALFLIDMDGFKEINDTLGHPIGDEALVSIASKLRDKFGDECDVARLGGDEFCIIKSGIRDEAHAASIARQACDLLNTRYTLEDAEFPLGASVGFAFCPDHTVSDGELLSFADTAMYHAKECRIGYSSYQPEMTDRLVEYRTMQEKLSVALERNEFFIVYQPQVSLGDGCVIGVEALLRWRSNGEVVSPVRFIPLLEQSREIVPVSDWLIRECCRQQAEWRKEGLNIDVSINISAVQFNDPRFLDVVADSMREFEVNPANIDFEITEGLLIDDVEEAVEILNRLKQMGISISIDDFGTGYSSLAYLRQFPLDRLKIDRAFIKDIPEDDDGVIAASIVVLAKSLDLKVLAEGVETEEHIQFLETLGCDEYQGYFFSRPVGPDEILRLRELAYT